MSVSVSEATELAQRLAQTSLTDLPDELDLSALTKQSLVSPSADDNDRIKSQIQDKLDVGMGETLWHVDYDDTSEDEFVACYETIKRVSAELNACATILYTTQKGNSQTGYILIRQKPGSIHEILEMRVAVGNTNANEVGNVDAGKSTLLGVLTKNILDDGRGKARVNLFRHKHEVDSGRTSSVGMEIMGFDEAGALITPASLGKPKPSWEDICQVSSKILTFVDLAGHEKYLKTTVFGMTGSSPDFVMLMIASNNGIVGMTKEHLGLALALQVPVFVVLTKIDMCPPNILEATINHLTKILKSSGCRKMPIFVNSMEDVVKTAEHFVSERVCPIFQVSNVTGLNLDLLRTFLNILRADSGKYDISKPVEYQITDVYSVPGVGTVVAYTLSFNARGTLINGVVHAGDSLLLGPDANGAFIPTVVKSIQRKRLNVPLCVAGQNTSFALKKVKRSMIRKGMVMTSKSLNPKAAFEFDAEILVLFHQTTISPRYQAMMHSGCVRQTVRIVRMDKSVLRTGDRATVRFRYSSISLIPRFLRFPEFMKEGQRILFREGRTKGIGRVVKLIYADNGTDQPSSSSSTLEAS